MGSRTGRRFYNPGAHKSIFSFPTTARLQIPEHKITTNTQILSHADPRRDEYNLEITRVSVSVPVAVVASLAVPVPVAVAAATVVAVSVVVAIPVPVAVTVMVSVAAAADVSDSITVAVIAAIVVSISVSVTAAALDCSSIRNDSGHDRLYIFDCRLGDCRLDRSRTCWKIHRH
jgi:hypothetical protein